MLYRVEIDGHAVPFKLGAECSWTLTDGVIPPIQRWELPRSMARSILSEKLGQEIELFLNGIKVERVVVVGNAPSPDPRTEFVLLSDDRLYLLFGHMARTVNRKRHVSTTQILDQAKGLVEVPTIVFEVRYVPYTLKGFKAAPDPSGKTTSGGGGAGVPWTWPTHVDDVLGSACRAAQGRKEIHFVVDPGPLDVETSGAFLQETWTDDPTYVTIAKALGTAPGRSIYVDLQGTIHVFDRLLGSEKAFFEKLPQSLWIRGMGSVVYRDMAAFRSNVYWADFDKALEVRVDVLGSPTTSSTDAKELPFGELVVTNPLQTLTVKGRTVAQGSVLTVDEALPAFGTPPDNPLAKGPLTDDLIRTRFNGQGTTSILDQYVLSTKTGYSPEWDLITAEVRKRYRRFVRINPRFWGRVETGDTVILTVWDSVTGTRAKSPVYVDFTRHYEGFSDYAGYNTSLGTTTTSWNKLRALCVKAPFELRWWDREQGILELVPQEVPGRFVSETIPSAVDNLPGTDPFAPKKGNLPAGVRPIVWDACDWVSASKWNLSFILSLKPGAPNSTAKLFQLLTDPITGFGAAAPAIVERLESGFKGPDRHVRVNLTDARFGWTDSDSDQTATLQHFGIGLPEDLAKDDPVPAPIVPLNLHEELIPVARAAAAAHVADYFDHYEGTLGIPMWNEVVKPSECVPIGSLRSVTFRVTRNAAMTVLEANNVRADLNPLALLPAHVRKNIAHEAPL